MVFPNESLAPSIQSLTTRWQEQGIRYVICELPDMAGMPRSKVIPLERFPHVAAHGLNMIALMVASDSASQIVPQSGYAEEHLFGDCLLKPDLATAQVVPWWPHTGRVICDPVWPETGAPLEAAPRVVLKRVLEQLQERGITARIALEFELYLLRDLATLTPASDALHIFHTPLTMLPVMTRLLNDLSQMEIDILAMNYEFGPGQYELTYREKEGLRAADTAYTFKQGVKAIARQEGYHATFMTKPFPDHSASGAHVHLSLWNEHGQNIFQRASSGVPGVPLVQDSLSEVARHVIAGMLEHAPAALALVAPTPNCYSSFDGHSFVPVNRSYGIDDRTALVRVKTTGENGAHLEYRLPRAICNPYLAIAAVLGSALLGIQEKRCHMHKGKVSPGKTRRRLPCLRRCWRH